MPELPEVEQARRYLEAKALNRRVISVDVRDAGVLQDIDAGTFRSSIEGRSLTSAGRRGKQMFIGLDDGAFMTIHLGMTGDVVMEGEGPEPRYSRIVFRLNDGSSLFYADQRKFGAVGLAGSIEQFVARHNLGPDALNIERNDFLERASGRKMAIKSVLLDQSIVAGIGNLYADEVLFQARIHPETRTDALSNKKLGEIHMLMGIVLRKSISVSSDFLRLPAGYLLRNREEGAECPRHNGTLETIKVGGRTSVFCPRCQQAVVNPGRAISSSARIRDGPRSPDR